ncbi:MAG: hypothetical protein ACREL9_00835 [Gemmatimonadales bacterium]
MAPKEKERDWDKEMAEVDKLLAKLPSHDPLPHGSADPTVKRPAVPAAAHGGAGVGADGSRAGTWLRVGLGLLLAAGITTWPYSHGCGFRLIFYLVAVGTLVVTGVWTGLSSWKRRLGLAHLLSLGLVTWGLALAARAVLPRVGYAKADATWLCRTTPPSN